MNNSIKIDFNKPYLTGKELVYIKDAVENSHISGDGQFTKKCQTLLENELGVKKILLTTSCTHALEMAAILLDIQPGDEVIVPSFTFVTTINAFVMHGAKPVFIDIRPDTLNMDEEKLEKLITPKTKAILPVHYAGIACNMDAIMQISQKNNIAVVEDNAHGLFGKYKGKYLGTFGDIATQSFHETKNITCGEGGAILINNPDLIQRAEIIREKGTDRSRFFRGQVDKYTWVDIGSSYLPSDILSAFLYAQLEDWKNIQEKRKKIWHFYNDNLQTWALENQIKLPTVSDDCDQSYHMYYILLPSEQYRRNLIKHLKERGIISVFHYLPLHDSKMGRNWGYKRGDFPATERISDQLLRLPFFNELNEEMQLEVITALKEFKMQ